MCVTLNDIYLAIADSEAYVEMPPRPVYVKCKRKFLNSLFGDDTSNRDNIYFWEMNDMTDFFGNVQQLKKLTAPKVNTGYKDGLQSLKA